MVAINPIYFFVVYIAINMMGSLGFISYLFKENTDLTLLDKVFLSILLGPLVLLGVVYLELLLNIKITSPILIANIGFLSLINLFIYLKHKRDELPKVSKENILIITLLSIVVFIRLFPARNLIIPLFHDPISHAQWLKYLLQNGKEISTSWYPQGLEYYLSYFNLFYKDSWSNIVLLGSNVFVSLIPFSIYYFIKLVDDKFSRKRFIAFVLASAVSFPNLLPAVAGKNSTAMAFVFVPFFLYFLYRKSEKTTDVIALGILTFIIFLIHYPTGGFLFLLLAIYYIYLLFKMFSRKQFDYGLIKRLALLFSISFAGILSLFLTKYPIYLRLPLTNDGSVQGLVDLVMTKGPLSYAIKDFISTLFYFYGTWGIDTFNLFGVMGLIFVVVAFGGASSLIFYQNSNINRIALNFTLSFVVLYSVTSFALLYNPIFGVFLNLESQAFSFFVLIILSTLLIDETINRIYRYENILIKFVVLTIISLVFIYGNYSIFRKIEQASTDGNLIQAADYHAFQKINSLKIPIEEKILVQMILVNKVAFAVDSGAWLSTFTNNKIEVDFSEYTKTEANKIFELYSNLNIEEKKKSAIKDLYCEYNVKYVYWGSKQVFGKTLAKEVFDNDKSYKKIFDNGAALYQINEVPCK